MEKLGKYDSSKNYHVSRGKQAGRGQGGGRGDRGRNDRGRGGDYGTKPRFSTVAPGGKLRLVSNQYRLRPIQQGVVSIYRVDFSPKITEASETFLKN